MTFKKFKSNDVVHSTIVAKPDFNFTIHNGNVYINQESSETGDFSSNKIKHVPQGYISLYELNINRPSYSMISQFIEKDTTRYAYKTVSTSKFDDANQFSYGDKITKTYPLSASVNRIYVPTGTETEERDEFGDLITAPHANKKYIRSLKNVITSQNSLTNAGLKYDKLGTDSVNMICIPGIFYGSKVARETVELNFFITGTLTAQAKDTDGSGMLYETVGPRVGDAVGMVLYNHGIILLSGSWSQNAGAAEQDKYFSAAANSSPSWLSFGTGLDQVGSELPHGAVTNSSYQIKFKGTNKIPTLTMLTHADKHELNFSHNPTFIDKNKINSAEMSKHFFKETQGKIKNIKKSEFVGYEEDFENITYISKIGIYDENKNLIAIASLANPVKKTEAQDYMFKLRLDF